MNSLKKTIGPRIKSFRRQLYPKMTQDGLAKVIGVEKNTVYRWEKGLVYPEPDNLEAIASALSISVSELIGMTEPKTPPATVKSLLKALSELQKEKEDLEKILPKELISAWSSASQTRRDRALATLLGKPEESAKTKKHSTPA